MLLEKNCKFVKKCILFIQIFVPILVFRTLEIWCKNTTKSLDKKKVTDFRFRSFGAGIVNCASNVRESQHCNKNAEFKQ